MGWFDSPPPKFGPKAVVDAFNAKKQKFLEELDTQFGGEPVELPIMVPPFRSPTQRCD